MNRRKLGLLAASTLLLAACAAPPPYTEKGDDVWEGRLALTIETLQPEYFSTAFRLRGDARQGWLDLYSPLGSTVARMAWRPGLVQLLQGDGQTQRVYASTDELTQEITGAAIPLPALFSWLQGRPAAVLGWEVDLSRRNEGRLRARRTAPLPAVNLRVILDPS